MNIIDLRARPLSGWKQTVLNHYAFLPYWWIRGIHAENRRALMSQKLEQTLAAEGTCLLGCNSEEGSLLGFAHMRRLDWDAEHFGVEIWRLDHLGIWDASGRTSVARALVQGCLEAARKQGCQNLQANVPIDNLSAVHALEDGGFHTMEIQTIWLFDLNGSSIPCKTNSDLIRDSRPADTESMIELARKAYASIPHRSYVDPHFSAKANNGVWAEWMRNACSGQLADHVAVAESGGEVIGYSTLRYHADHSGLCNARIGELGLGAMSPDSRNRGISTDLVIHNLQWLRRREADYCFVGTQGNNIPPQRVWLKAGFKPATMRLTLHHWTDEDESADTIEIS
jgi:GNAT superfamily N-acetyltransferase